MRKILLAVALAAAAAAGLTGDSLMRQSGSRMPLLGGRIVISDDYGGSVAEYIERYGRERRAGATYRIDGLCISACTLIVGLVPADRVCVTDFAKLAFHSAWRQSMVGEAFSKEGTRMIWRIYPPAIRALLKYDHAWDGDGETADHPSLIYVDDAELLRIFKHC